MIAARVYGRGWGFLQCGNRWGRSAARGHELPPHPGAGAADIHPIRDMKAGRRRDRSAGKRVVLTRLIERIANVPDSRSPLPVHCHMPSDGCGHTLAKGWYPSADEVRSRNSLCDQRQWRRLGSSQDSLYSFHDIFYRAGVRRRNYLEGAIAFRAAPKMHDEPLIPILGPIGRD